jgi:predicted XRE-type DNA-binding protein
VIRADLLIQIQKVATARRLKQVHLAKLLRVSQPRVSDLLGGRLHLFSIDTLIDMLGRLGVQVRSGSSRRAGDKWPGRAGYPGVTPEVRSGRDGEIRTPDLLTPSQAR